MELPDELAAFDEHAAKHGALGGRAVARNYARVPFLLLLDLCSSYLLFFVSLLFFFFIFFFSSLSIQFVSHLFSFSVGLSLSTQIRPLTVYIGVAICMYIII